jgi:hypothetical protein
VAASYPTKTVEPFVVNWVSRRIGVKLQSKQVAVGPRKDGTPVHFTFDGVSEDGQIGLLVSTSQTVKPGRTRKLHMDASILLHAPFRRRLMVFISEDVRLNFLNKSDGLLPLGNIEMLVCDSLPAGMLKEIAKFQAKAKADVGDNGKQWKPGGHRK